MTIRRWHNAQTDPPKATGQYIVLTDNFDICVAKFYTPKKHSKRCGFTGVPGQRVAYWTELPDLPDEEATQDGYTE